ncbi:MAG: endonuclease/exonuclease/phosphatase family protein [Mycobacteriales bacterium]
MRIATFNVLHGRSISDGQVDIDRLARAALALDADVLALQEVDRDQPRSGGANLTAVVAEAMGAACWRFAPTLVGTPGGSWRPARPEDSGADGEPAYGVGLVSRLPVASWQVIALPKAPVRSPVFIPGQHRRAILLADEPRVGLAAVVQAPAGAMTVTTTHLSFVPLWNALQLRLLTGRLRRLPGPWLLLGDLNLPGPLPHLVTGWRSLGAIATYPAPAPRIQLDHVLGRGPLPPVLSVRAPELGISDHRALVVDLADTGPEPEGPARVG